jgi:hypothetical protein
MKNDNDNDNVVCVLRRVLSATVSVSAIPRRRVGSGAGSMPLLASKVKTL